MAIAIIKGKESTTIGFCPKEGPYKFRLMISARSRQFNLPLKRWQYLCSQLMVKVPVISERPPAELVLMETPGAVYKPYYPKRIADTVC